jgi:autotransporter-associated beta strand protein
VVLTGGGGSGASATAPAPTPNTSGGMMFTGAGTTTLSVANTYTGNTTISSGTLLVNGSTSTGAVTVNGGTLGGTGTIDGTVTVSSGGTLAPGSGGIGALTVSGNLTLNAGSTNVFDVDGSGSGNDMVAAGASVTYGGVLQIAPTGTFTTGQNFTLFSGAGAASASNFSSVTGSPGSGLGFTFTNGVLSVVTTGPSGPATITNSFSGGVLSLSWPAGQGWRLQMQTNSLTTGLGTNWNYITDGSLSGTNITVDSSKPTVFYRLRNP